jgi:hypothetical protein
LKFTYVRYSDTVIRPVIPIRVNYGKRSAAYDVLVDSGADINVFSEELAEVLGIDLETGVPAEVMGPTGYPAEVYIHPVKLTVGEHTFTAQVAFMPTANPFGLVGQRGFFDQFEVKFNMRKEEVEISNLL